ncbi:hypothetical protein EFP18_01455 [Burkholderia glumae]|nr:hypothetical protein DF052_02060 [Burkholderia glumae]UVS82959.1 hypothetical protein EFP18_01455 [Burkholderia glumae]
MECVRMTAPPPRPEPRAGALCAARRRRGSENGERGSRMLTRRQGAGRARPAQNSETAHGPTATETARRRGGAAAAAATGRIGGER